MLSKYGSTGVFYAFDPTFFSTMKAFASSIAVSFPYYDSNIDDNVNIKICMHISTGLGEMPCRDDAVAALEMILVWVSSLLHSIQTRIVSLHQ